MFPDGLLPGRRWRLVAVLAPVAALLVSAAIAVEVWADTVEGPTVPGAEPFGLAGIARIAELSIVFGLFLAVLVAAAASLVVRFRRGDPVTRLRVRLLMVAAGSVPLLLVTSWVAIGLGAPGEVAYSGFLAALLVLVPAAVAVAVLRHDLFDVDRLLGEGLAWVLTTLVSAGVFAAVVVLLGEGFGRDSRIGVTGAAFVSALCLLPLHRTLVGVVGRFVDRDRHVVLVRVRQFVRAVRDGSTEPEAVEDLLRAVVADPDLRVLLRRPGSLATEFVDLRGEPATVSPGCLRFRCARATLRSASSLSDPAQHGGCAAPGSWRSRPGCPSRSADCVWSCVARWTMYGRVGRGWLPPPNANGTSWSAICTTAPSSRSSL